MCNMNIPLEGEPKRAKRQGALRRKSLQRSVRLRGSVRSKGNRNCLASIKPTTGDDKAQPPASMAATTTTEVVKKKTMLKITRRGAKKLAMKIAKKAMNKMSNDKKEMKKQYEKKQMSQHVSINTMLNILEEAKIDNNMDNLVVAMSNLSLKNFASRLNNRSTPNADITNLCKLVQNIRLDEHKFANRKSVKMDNRRSFKINNKKITKKGKNKKKNKKHTKSTEQTKETVFEERPNYLSNKVAQILNAKAIFLSVDYDKMQRNIMEVQHILYHCNWRFVDEELPKAKNRTADPILNPAEFEPTELAQKLYLRTTYTQSSILNTMSKWVAAALRGLLAWQGRTIDDDEAWDTLLHFTEAFNEFFIVDLGCVFAYVSDPKKVFSSLLRHIYKQQTCSIERTRNFAALVLSLLFTELVSPVLLRFIRIRAPHLRSKAYTDFILFFLAGLFSNREYIAKHVEASTIRAMVPADDQNRHHVRQFFADIKRLEYVKIFRLDKKPRVVAGKRKSI